VNPQDKTATASVLEALFYRSITDDAARDGAMPTVDVADLDVRVPGSALRSALETLTAAGLVEETAAGCRLNPEALCRLALAGMAPAVPPAADWTTGAYVSDVSRADHGRIVLTVPGGPDRIEKATVTVDGSEATTRLLAGMLGQKGTLRFHVGEADHDIAGALADRRAEVTRLRELLVAAQESMGLQVVRVERGHGVVIICTAQGAHEKALADEMGAWMLEQGMRHPVVRAEQEQWQADVIAAQRQAAQTIILLHELHTRACWVLNASEENAEDAGGQTFEDALNALEALISKYPATMWEQAAEVARQAAAAKAVETGTPAPEQA